MNFLWCTINVKDIEESLNFYQNVVGLSVTSRLSFPGTELAFLGKGDTKLELIQGKGEPYRGGGVSIGFLVESLEEKMELVQEQGVQIHSGPFSPGPKTKFFFISDPDGMLVQFVEQKDA